MRPLAALRAEHAVDAEAPVIVYAHKAVAAT
jgi:hypothetical protein